MKIRSSFVSNSSSTSFIIAVPKDYELSEENSKRLREYIEDINEDTDWYYDMYGEGEEREYLEEHERVAMMIETGKEPPSPLDITFEITDEIFEKEVKRLMDEVKVVGTCYNTYDMSDNTLMEFFDILTENDEFTIAEIDAGPGKDSVLVNILADNFKDTDGIKVLQKSFLESEKKDSTI